MTEFTRIVLKPTFRSLSGRFVKASEEVFASHQEAIQELGETFIRIAREEAPAKSGKFRRSIRASYSNDQKTMSFRTHHAEPLGSWIIRGTRSHVIRPVRRKALRFYWEKGQFGPGIYFFMKVNHPGTQPNRYLDRALHQWDWDSRVDLLRRKISTRWEAVMVSNV